MRAAFADALANRRSFWVQVLRDGGQRRDLGDLLGAVLQRRRQRARLGPRRRADAVRDPPDRVRHRARADRQRAQARPAGRRRRDRRRARAAARSARVPARAPRRHRAARRPRDGAAAVRLRQRPVAREHRGLPRRRALRQHRADRLPRLDQLADAVRRRPRRAGRPRLPGDPDHGVLPARHLRRPDQGGAVHADPGGVRDRPARLAAARLRPGTALALLAAGAAFFALLGIVLFRLGLRRYASGAVWTRA